uniref:Uncharacterized protein n=1 Tax=Palpitomonas bilix TaxID=652834 RepID=A0A7S3G0N7_9EUKA
MTSSTHSLLSLHLSLASLAQLRWRQGEEKTDEDVDDGDGHDEREEWKNNADTHYHVHLCVVRRLPQFGSAVTGRYRARDVALSSSHLRWEVAASAVEKADGSEEEGGIGGGIDHCVARLVVYARRQLRRGVSMREGKGEVG